ncbi:hypothetical protein CUJ83_12810 [Methanocella sp. CWC-04]|uniref:UPF0305 protein CUJ83_12810 n=1 Tax=Methanooceanicella nereidis TaxID=2052831 RepID=A0AAP2RGM8_9EURY|nr:DUF2115 domain-containing protein [Methanocella sp. CWC-04]MCD1295877.1 hypothetical protein [Methanocella sp. CWC-04]
MFANEQDVSGTFNEHKSIFARLATIDKKSELARTLAQEIKRFSLYDLQVMSAFLEREINNLPSPYGENIRPYFIEQYFGRYYNILAIYNNGAFSDRDEEINDKQMFRDYCSTVISFELEYDKGSENRITMNDPFYSLYYYLLSCFYMFVLDEPGHPVGTPFPGGFTVQKINGEYYCPIRDKEKDVERSICNFCPAKQDETYDKS